MTTVPVRKRRRLCRLETNGYGTTRAMKFRTTAIWTVLISTGMLCLAMGAVRFQRKPRKAAASETAQPDVKPADVSVLPMRDSQPAYPQPDHRAKNSSRGGFDAAVPRQRVENYAGAPQFGAAGQQANSHPRFNSTDNFPAGNIANSSVAEPPNARWQKQNGSQEPEPWPFHRNSAGASRQTSQSQNSQSQPAPRQPTPRENSRIDDWPHRQPSVSNSANSHSYRAVNSSGVVDRPPVALPDHYRPEHYRPEQYRPEQFSNSTGGDPIDQNTNYGSPAQQSGPQPPRSPGHGRTTDDLLNPALAFGPAPQYGANARPEVPAYAPVQPQQRPQHQTSPTASAFETAPRQHSLSRVTDPFAANSGLSTSGSVPILPAALPQPGSPQTAMSHPSLSNLPAPQGSPSQTVQQAGHAGAEHRVIHAYAESVTPRNNVTVGQWSGPQRRPVQSIQQVRFDACPDCEDMQRIPAETLLNPYAARANSYPTSAAMPRQSGQLVELPRNYAPWWEEVINKPMRTAPATHPVNVESLILAAIEYSPQVTAFRIDPIVRETQILEEAAEFDWQSFVETRFDDSNDPIGNSLTTGDNSNRFVDKNLSGRLGLEKRMAQGGTVDVSQRFGLQDNNSTFFTPRQQGTSRLELNFTQPLLRGAGQTYNESRTVLAMLDHQISEDELQDSLQDHLLEVYTTYWNLYRARAVRLQKERLLRRAIDVEQKLAARRGIDSVKRQVLRARAAIASRRSEIARESRLRLLVDSPNLKRSTVVELLPDEAPMSEYITVSMRGSVETALQNRPDIRRAITLMKETAVRLEVSKNELLPKLDLVLGTYVAGLRGQSQIDTAWANQFQDGRPGYSVGVMLQYPLGNRAAKARYARREWEVARTLKEFEASVEASLSDVELSVREFETSYQEMLSRFQSMIAADTEANYLLERWRLLPGNDQTTSFLLEDLLDAQERVAMEEQDFVEAQVTYVLSVVRLKRASGILLSCDCGNSPVSFMTPAPRRSDQHNPLALPEPLPRPYQPRPALPNPVPAKTQSTQPLPIIPLTEPVETPQPVLRVDPASRGVRPVPANVPDNSPSINPLPSPSR
jgi:outer membrane protein TolC